MTLMTNCIVCGTDRLENYFDKDGFIFLLCKNCGFIFVHTELSNLQEYYNEGNYLHGDSGWGYVNYEADKAPMKKNYLKILQKIQKWAPGTRLLDVGAANGYFVEIASSCGFTSMGIDINHSAVDEGIKMGRSMTEEELLNSSMSNGSFNVITLFDFIEHVPASQLSDHIKKINSLLSPRGVLVIVTPNTGSVWARLLKTKWHAFIPPEHLSYFDRTNISLYLRNNGFDIKEIRTINKNFSLQYIFNILYRWQALLIWKKLTIFFEKLPRIGKISLPLPISDNILIIAQKNN